MSDGTSQQPTKERPWPQESFHIRHVEQDELHELMWDLNTKDKIPGLTWWWWWWIFFIRNPKNPERPRQLMILWSTKNCEKILVDDFLWKKEREITKETTAEGGQVMDFNGMIAAWYYDGDEMHDPFLLEECDFKVERNTDHSGAVLPSLEKDYRFYGKDNNWVVNLKGGPVDFHFKMGPRNKFLSSPRFSSKTYVKHYGYEILKLYGTTLEGEITSPKESEKIDGYAYFQKVTVKAPSPPWYWLTLQTERGDHIEFFNPHVGLDFFRKTEAPRSKLDGCEIPLSKNLQFYDATRDFLFRYRKLKVRKEFDENDLPTFHVHGWGPNGDFKLSLKAYSRAVWRFEQKTHWWFNSILFYNEYPVALEKFDLKWRFEDGEEYHLKREDLGFAVGNCEHAWGKLI